jgi:hypothetical protein
MQESKIVELFLEYLKEEPLVEAESDGVNYEQARNMIGTAGAFGKGGTIPSDIRDMGSKIKSSEGSKRAMSSLGISKGSIAQGEDWSKCMDVLRQAISNNGDMRTIFNMDGNNIVSNLDRARSVRLLQLTLIAAIVSGTVSLRSGVRFAKAPDTDETSPITIRLLSA